MQNKKEKFQKQLQLLSLQVKNISPKKGEQSKIYTYIQQEEELI